MIMNMDAFLLVFSKLGEEQEFIDTMNFIEKALTTNYHRDYVKPSPWSYFENTGV